MLKLSLSDSVLSLTPSDTSDYSSTRVLASLARKSLISECLLHSADPKHLLR